MIMRRKASEPDPILVNDWHAVVDHKWLESTRSYHTTLLGVPLAVACNGDGTARVTRTDNGESVRTDTPYGFVWACLGTPERDILYIPEAYEPDRIVVTGGSFGVHVSGLRAVENFLDMGHFAFVHTGYLGEEPHTEILPYNVEFTDDDGVLATDCKAYQPKSSPVAKEGITTEYIYKVYRPYTVALYKTNPAYEDRMDYIALLVQPVDEEHCVAHSLICYLEDGEATAASVRLFMQLIFAQDKPILEHQMPKRLPLDPRAETPIRADASSVYYRRWLREHNVRYGAIPVAS